MTVGEFYAPRDLSVPDDVSDGYLHIGVDSAADPVPGGGYWIPVSGEDVEREHVPTGHVVQFPKDGKLPERRGPKDAPDHVSNWDHREGDDDPTVRADGGVDMDPWPITVTVEVIDGEYSSISADAITEFLTEHPSGNLTDEIISRAENEVATDGEVEMEVHGPGTISVTYTSETEPITDGGESPHEGALDLCEELDLSLVSIHDITTDGWLGPDSEYSVQRADVSEHPSGGMELRMEVEHFSEENEPLTDGGIPEDVHKWEKNAHENVQKWGLQHPDALLLAMGEEMGELAGEVHGLSDYAGKGRRAEQGRELIRRMDKLGREIREFLETVSEKDGEPAPGDDRPDYLTVFPEDMNESRRERLIQSELDDLMALGYQFQWALDGDR